MVAFSSCRGIVSWLSECSAVVIWCQQQNMGRPLPLRAMQRSHRLGGEHTICSVGTIYLFLRALEITRTHRCLQRFRRRDAEIFGDLSYHLILRKGGLSAPCSPVHIA